MASSITKGKIAWEDVLPVRYTAYKILSKGIKLENDQASGSNWPLTENIEDRGNTQLPLEYTISESHKLENQKSQDSCYSTDQF